MSNLLKDRYPELLKEWDYEKNTIDISLVTYGSTKKVWWLCKKKHSFEQVIIKRTTRSQSCPYCSGKKAGYDNTLKNTHRKLVKEWDFDKNTIQPNEVTYGSKKKVWWRCNEGHSFEELIYNRTHRKVNCRKCGISKFPKNTKLNITHKNLVKEWDYEKNTIQPNEVTYGSNKKVWWRCNEGHSFEASILHRTRANSGCPVCKNQKTGYENDLKSKYPDIVNSQWDYERNVVSPEKITPGSNKKVWWKCKEGHSFKVTPNEKLKSLYEGCPFCDNKLVSSTNNLLYLFPDISKEWDLTKNIKNASEVLAGSKKKYWWICKEGHSFSQSTLKRTYRKQGCPYCSGQLASSTNNLLYLFPNISKEWDYKKNNKKPENYTSQSHSKVWWICKNGHNWKSAIFLRTPTLSGSRGPGGCPFCKLTPRSREEVYLLFELKQFFNINENDHKIKLKRVEDVDIKLVNEKVVIEYDGSYWHKDKAERDKAKTKALEKAGWTVIRIREKPLKVLSRKYNVSSKTGDYKETANKVLKKLNQLGYEVKGLDKYLQRKTLVNKKEAEKYIDKLLKEKNKK